MSRRNCELRAEVKVCAKAKSGDFAVNRILIACMIACGLCSLHAADPAGTIAGTVTDPTGAVVAGAKVTATEPSTGLARSTSTGQDGAYILPLMPAGRYSIV